MFETLDGRPFGIQPVLPIAATQPPGESSRLDAFRAPIAVDVLAALGQADGDPELAEALDRWELSLFQSEPFRSEQVRAALHSLLGESWPMRACVLLAEDARSREELYAELTALSSARRRRPPLWMRPDGRSSPSFAPGIAIASRSTSTANCSGSNRGPRRALSPSDADSARIRYPAAIRPGLPSRHGGVTGGPRAPRADRGARSGRSPARCSSRSFVRSSWRRRHG